MYAKQHQLSLEFEMIRWMVIITLAGILALAVASSAWGRDVPKRAQPRVLPDAATELSRPMAALPSDLQVTDDEPLVRQLWSALAYHRGNDPAAAREVWSRIQLPYQSEAWQYVALGVTYLQEGDCEAACMAFQVAQGWEPHNPVPFYYLGIVRLTQAQRAEAWHDGVVPGDVQFVDWVADGRVADGLGRNGGLNSPDVVPNSKAMYEWVAMVEFTRAIELAGNVALDQPLVATARWGGHQLVPENPEAAPHVGDLLAALGADNFAGKAHNTLGSMLIERGALERAEQHLDAAAATGLTIVHGYADLGAAREAAGEHQEAVRAYMKAAAHGDRSPQTTHGVLENFGKALFNSR
jgi:Flp pilus assembly protein TadD